MISSEESARLEYAALMRRVEHAERLSFHSGLAAGVGGAALLAHGIAAGQPGLMVPVVLTSMLGFMGVSRWREQAALAAGYLESHHESEHREPAYFTRLARLEGAAWDGDAREWHPAACFGALAVAAAVFAWTTARVGAHGELWAGLVTGGALAFVSWSISETARALKLDAPSAWRRADTGLREVKRASSM